MIQALKRLIEKTQIKSKVDNVRIILTHQFKCLSVSKAQFAPLVLGYLKPHFDTRLKVGRGVAAEGGATICVREELLQTAESPTYPTAAQH